MAELTGNESPAPLSEGALLLQGNQADGNATGGRVSLAGLESNFSVAVGQFSLSGNGIIADALRSGSGLKTVWPQSTSTTVYPAAP